jgi:hypothetical protein
VATQTVREAPVFSAGGRSFKWEDVIDAAREWGEWQALERRTRDLLAAEQLAIEAGELPPGEHVSRAANAFRYERNLLAADEVQRWLDVWGISFDEWLAFTRRSLIRQPQAPKPDVSVPDQEVARATWVHAVCSGELESFARRLARQVAVHVRPGAERDLLTAGTEAGSPDEVERFCRSKVTEETLRAEIAANLIGWTRVDCRFLEHPDGVVLREARLCVTEDGRDFEDVARDAGAACKRASVYLDDVEPSLRTRLLSANPGDLLGPFPVEDGHWLVLVVDRAAPTIEDEALRERAARSISERALSAEVGRSVTWHEHL